MKTIRQLLIFALCSVSVMLAIPVVALAEDTLLSSDDEIQESLVELDSLLQSASGEVAPPVAEMQAQLKNISDENQILKAEIDRLNRQLEKVEAERIQAKADFEKLFAKGAKATDNDAEQARLAATVERLKRELSAARETNETLRQAQARANEPETAAGGDSNRVRTLQAAVDEMKDVDAQRKAAMDDLFKQLALQKKNVASRDQMLADLQAALDAEKARVSERDKALSDRDVTLAESEAALASRQQVITALEGNVAEARRQAQDTAAALAARESDLAGLRAELEQIKLVDAQRRKTLDETLASLATAEQRGKTLGEDLDRARAQYTASSEETAAQIAALTSRNSLLEGEIARMERDVKAAVADRDAALAQVSELQSLLAARDAQVVDLEAQAARLAAVDVQRRKAMDQILLDTATLEQDKARLELDVQRLTLKAATQPPGNDNAAASEQLVELKNANASLQARVAELEGALRDARAATGAEASTVSATDAMGAVAVPGDWQQERQQLEVQLSELRNGAARDADQLETMTRKLSQAQQNVLELTARINDLESRKTDVRESDLFKELQQINTALREKMIEVEADRQRLAKLADAAASTEAAQAKEIETHTARLAEMDAALSEAVARETEYKEFIERLVPQVETLEQQVVSLTQERQDLTGRLLRRDEDLQALKLELERREHRLAKAERVASVLEKARAEVLRAGDREKLNMHYNMAAVYARDGKFEQAENEYLQALRIDPADADVHYNLGILYEDEMKEPEKATSHYRRYLQLNPHGPDADRVRTWLMKLEMKAER